MGGGKGPYDGKGKGKGNGGGQKGKGSSMGRGKGQPAPVAKMDFFLTPTALFKEAPLNFFTPLTTRLFSRDRKRYLRLGKKSKAQETFVMNMFTKMPMRKVEIFMTGDTDGARAIWSIEATIGDPRMTRVLKLNCQGADVITPGAKSEKR